MSEMPTHGQGPDFRMVDDPGVRQALRSMHQQLTEMLHRQQEQIDALMDLLVEKNFTSFGELKRQLVRIQQNAQRSERIHQALSAPASNVPAVAPAPGMRAALR